MEYKFKVGDKIKILDISSKCISHKLKVGDITKIVSLEKSTVYTDKFWIRTEIDPNNGILESNVELYQEEPKFKKGDIVVCLPEPNTNPIGSNTYTKGGAGYASNLCFKVSSVDNCKDYQVLWGGLDAYGVYSNSVRYATQEEIDEYNRLGKSYYITDISKPKFEIGKWYKNLGYDGTYIVKAIEGSRLEGNQFYCGDYITPDKHFKKNTKVIEWLKWNTNTCEIPISEIQQYLPDGHVDKIDIPERISFYVKYCDEFTEDLYNKLQDWAKNNSKGIPRDYQDTYEGLKKHKFYVFDNYGLNHKGNPNYNLHSYGVDNNRQNCKDEYSVQKVKGLIGYKDPIKESKSLVGRYLKALVDKPNAGSVKAGEIGIITRELNGRPNNVDFPSQKNYSINEFTYDKGKSYQLMPEGFHPEQKEEWVPKVGDWVRVTTDSYLSHKTTKNPVFQIDSISDGIKLHSKETGKTGWIWLEDVVKAEPHEIPVKSFPSFDLLEEAKPRSQFRVGDKVRALSQSHGWGSVEEGDIGIVTNIYQDGDLLVNFPNQSAWTGKVECFELVEEDSIDEFKWELKTSVKYYPVPPSEAFKVEQSFDKPIKIKRVSNKRKLTIV